MEKKISKKKLATIKEKFGLNDPHQRVVIGIKRNNLGFKLIKVEGPVDIRDINARPFLDELKKRVREQGYKPCIYPSFA